MIYARGIEEALGHVASARSEYRQISREWHTYLGFSGFQRLAKIQPVASQTPDPKQATDLLMNHSVTLKRKALSELPNQSQTTESSQSIIFEQDKKSSVSVRRQAKKPARYRDELDEEPVPKRCCS